MAVVLYYMFYLLESYGTDPEATYLVNERELYFVPVVNPDGYVYNQTTNPNGGGLWRKNRRVNGGGVFGVDLNRNYGYRWGFDNVGSSPTPSSDTYRGPAPFSEPETSAIRAFHQGRTIWNGFHYHAYGNYLIHPYAYAATAFPPAPDHALYTRYGAALSAMNGYLVGNFAQTLGYLGNGEVIDWSYGEQVEKNKVFAILPEVGGAGDGFWPPPSRIVPIAEQNRGPNLYDTWIAGARAELVGVARDSLVPPGASGEVVATIENIGLGAPAADVTLELTTSDPLVTIDDPVIPFPAVPPLATGSNLGNPLVFTVAPEAPAGHLITPHPDRAPGTRGAGHPGRHRRGRAALGDRRRRERPAGRRPRAGLVPESGPGSGGAPVRAPRSRALRGDGLRRARPPPARGACRPRIGRRASGAARRARHERRALAEWGLSRGRRGRASARRGPMGDRRVSLTPTPATG